MFSLYIPNELIALIYDHLDNDLSKIVFQLVCKQFRQVAAPKDKNFVISMEYLGNQIGSTSSISFFEWMRSIFPNLRLEHITKSNNLVLIKYAVEELEWKLDREKVYLTSSLPCLQYLSTLQNFKWKENYLDYLAYTGSIECLKYSLQSCYPCKKTFEAAAYGGHMEIIKYLHQIQCPWDAGACYNAAEKGHLQVLKYLHENGCPWSFLLWNTAASNGHLEVIQYLHQNYCPWSEDAFRFAAENGHFEIIKYLYQNGYQCGYEAYIGAASCGHLDILQYLLQRGYPWNDFRMMDGAAYNGHLEIVQYLHKKGYAFSVWTFDSALSSGNLDLIKYLHQNGCSSNNYVCVEPASRGHLEVLAYLHENGFPWCKRVFEKAAQSGHLDIVNYLHQNGCPWSHETFETAAYNGHLEIIKYFHENGYPLDVKLLYKNQDEKRLKEIERLQRLGFCQVEIYGREHQFTIHSIQVKKYLEQMVSANENQ